MAHNLGQGLGSANTVTLCARLYHKSEASLMEVGERLLSGLPGLLRSVFTT